MPKVIAETANMSREDWLKNRLGGIGGSDAAAIAGANPYKSPIVAYMEKVGLYDAPEPGEAAYWGNTLEPVVADEFVKRMNADREPEQHLRIQRRNAIFAHDEYDFMRANIDRLIYCPIRGKGILEIKTANQFLSDEWAGDDVPNQYYLQLQHYLAIMGVDYGYMAVLIGGQKYKHYLIERDKDIVNFLIDLERNFWVNHVLAKIPPEIDGADSTTEMYKIMYPQSIDNPPLELGVEVEGLINTITDLKSLIETHTEQKKKAENMIKDLMQDNAEAYAGLHKITWKTTKNGQRRFSIKLGKGVMS